jgi:hypothetical protein
VNEIEDRFNSSFSTWGIHVPSQDIANRRRGKIVKAGWAIWYLFGSDQKGEYLDYYASHRMTNDRHVRIYASGEVEGLPTIGEFRPCSQDPEEDKKLEAAYYAENQRIATLLEEKGFGIAGDEPGGVQINRALRENKLEG